ncbi:hypothetical protein [Bradyrhizobium manausense]|uniref:Uncharacterized protein n=1 Tax=Bradyrhizobium manausense TaxID=989370 RepID=A0A0R3D0G1_9BRAD|nr:hypothetical protein [Bradyrhizobium manausense]KRQ03288.1 hypothetical protein AOQ71_31670 [Bradyrhizobium manausense]
MTFGEKDRKPVMPKGEVLMHRQQAHALNAKAELLRARAALHHAKADLQEKREGKESTRYVDIPVPALAVVVASNKPKKSALKPAATAKAPGLAKSAKAFGAKPAKRSSGK